MQLDDNRASAREMTRAAKQAVGLADEKDRKALWYTCQTGPDTVGDVLVTVEVIPKELVDALPVGKGRNAPNQYPYLPPPVGRMRFSLNPFYILQELLGTKRLLQVPQKFFKCSHA
jgi:hypothetical protein